MQDKVLQALTASEPLLLQQEYEMQKSWMQDDDSEKLALGFAENEMVIIISACILGFKKSARGKELAP